MFRQKRFRPFLSLLSFYKDRVLKGEFSFACLNLSQFLGALNDNLYKLLMIFLLIASLPTKETNKIVSMAGAIYVLPFLLFSASAGILADRFSKQKLIRVLKGTEVLLMVFALLAFYIKDATSCYILLFLLASHSAIFGPSKYGIIPEIVDPQELTRANSQIIAFTYLATILGTFLASFLTDLTQGGFVLSVSFCLLFALLGFFSSLGIQKTPPQRSDKEMTPFFISDTVKTIMECKKTPLLAPCLFGSAYFLFVGAFTQLNVIPFSSQSLGLSEYMGGYLFLLTALGIAGGSFLSSKLLKSKLDVGTSCLAGIGLGIMFILLALFSPFLLFSCVFLVLLGVFGGVFVVSFDTFIQVNSPMGKRGQAIGAANFLGFFGVLIACLVLYLFGELLGLSAATGFFYMGLITLIVTTILSLELLEICLPSLSRLLPSSDHQTVLDPLQLIEKSRIFLLEGPSLPLLLLAARHTKRCRVFCLSYKKGVLSHLLNLSPAFSFVPPHTPLETLLAKAKGLDEDVSVCLVLNRTFPPKKSRKIFLSFKEADVCSLKLQEKKGKKRVVLVEAVDSP